LPSEGQLLGIVLSGSCWLSVCFPAEGVDGGSISMLAVLVG
jgi:hypothetical protein